MDEQKTPTTEMNDDAISKKRHCFFRLNSDVEERKKAVPYFLCALVLLAGIFFTEVFNALKSYMFTWIYYGNLDVLFYAVISSLYLMVFYIFFHKVVKKHVGYSPLFNKHEKMTVKRKILLYLLTALPVVITAIALGFKFKLEYGLGERVTAMTLVGNAGLYLLSSIKIFGALMMIAFLDRAYNKLFKVNGYIPFGGIIVALTYGAIEFAINPNIFTLLNILYYVYFGIIYQLSEERFGVAYACSIVLMIV